MRSGIVFAMAFGGFVGITIWAIRTEEWGTAIGLLAALWVAIAAVEWMWP